MHLQRRNSEQGLAHLGSLGRRLLCSIGFLRSQLSSERLPAPWRTASPALRRPLRSGGSLRRLLGSKRLPAPGRPASLLLRSVLRLVVLGARPLEPPPPVHPSLPTIQVPPRSSPHTQRISAPSPIAQTIPPHIPIIPTPTEAQRVHAFGLLYFSTVEPITVHSKPCSSRAALEMHIDGGRGRGGEQLSLSGPV